jgi:flagellar export protein FliJ
MREKQAQAELLTRKANLAREQQTLVQMQQVERDLVARMDTTPGQLLDIADRIATAYALEQHRKAITQQERVIVQHEGYVAEQQLVLKQASIDVKALERLSEKHKEEFRLEQASAEAVFLDDLATQQFIRKGVEAEHQARAAVSQEDS